MTPRKRPTGGLGTSVSEELREAIIRGVLSPGEHLGQTEIAERFGISKVPVREALKLLAAEGIVTHDPNRGYFVAKISSDEAKQLYKLRRLIESELLATVVWPTKEKIAELKRRFGQVDEMFDKSERAKWAAALRDLRRDILDLSPQKVLLREALRLWALTDRYRSLLPARQAPSGEHELVKALDKRDRKALLRAYHEDRDRIESLLLAILDERSA